MPAAMAACAIGAWSADKDRNGTLSPADVVALRFPDDWSASAPPAPASAVRGTDEVAARVLLDPHPTYPQAAARPEAASAPPLRQAVDQPAGLKSKPAIIADRRSTRPETVLNDAQIASIKQRLNLTPDQERMWPSVEAALRKLAYARNQTSHGAGVHGRAEQAATIDAGGADVQHLTSAAVPLIMSFSDEQKRELQSLAHVAGLEKLVPRF